MASKALVVVLKRRSFLITAAAALAAMIARPSRAEILPPDPKEMIVKRFNKLLAMDTAVKKKFRDPDRNYSGYAPGELQAQYEISQQFNSLMGYTLEHFGTPAMIDSISVQQVKKILNNDYVGITMDTLNRTPPGMIPLVLSRNAFSLYKLSIVDIIIGPNCKIMAEKYSHLVLAA